MACGFTEDLFSNVQVLLRINAMKLPAKKDSILDRLVSIMRINIK